jgi:hypothetical protein
MTMQIFIKKKLGDGFTEIQGPAWSGFLRMQAQLLRTLNAELQADHGITLSEYEVLLLLDLAPNLDFPSPRLLPQSSSHSVEFRDWSIGWRATATSGVKRVHKTREFHTLS